MVQCGSQLHQLMTAFQMFANDHQGSLPGGYFDRTNADEWKQDWLFGNGTVFTDAPQGGTIFPYVSNSYKIFLCPNHEQLQGTGSGSNGRFDYAFFQVFAGRRSSTSSRPRRSTPT